jgi:hypothetical protein
MTDRDFLDRALRLLARAVQEAGLALPRSWVATGDPDLKSLRETEEWKRWLRRQSSGEDDAPRRASKDIEREAARLAEIPLPDSHATERALAEQLKAAVEAKMPDKRHDSVTRPETPLRSATFRQWAWGLAALTALAFAALVVSWVSPPPLLATPAVAALLMLAALAAYRFNLARKERWPDLPTSEGRSREPAEPARS